MKIHAVVNVSHTTPCHADPDEISVRTEAPPLPFITDEGDVEYEIEQILHHRISKSGFEFLVQWERYPTYDSSRVPEQNFVYEDDSVNDDLLDYLRLHNLDAEDAIFERR